MAQKKNEVILKKRGNACICFHACIIIRFNSFISPGECSSFTAPCLVIVGFHKNSSGNLVVGVADLKIEMFKSTTEFTYSKGSFKKAFSFSKVFWFLFGAP